MPKWNIDTTTTTPRPDPLVADLVYQQLALLFVLFRSLFPLLAKVGICFLLFLIEGMSLPYIRHPYLWRSVRGRAKDAILLLQKHNVFRHAPSSNGHCMEMWWERANSTFPPLVRCVWLIREFRQPQQPNNRRTIKTTQAGRKRYWVHLSNGHYSMNPPWWSNPTASNTHKHTHIVAREQHEKKERGEEETMVHSTSFWSCCWSNKSNHNNQHSVALPCFLPCVEILQLVDRYQQWKWTQSLSFHDEKRCNAWMPLVDQPTWNAHIVCDDPMTLFDRLGVM